MQAFEFINTLIPTLKFKDTAGFALGLMEELRISSLPVVDEGSFIGFIKIDQLGEQSGSEKLIESLEIVCDSSWVFSDKPLYDVFKIISEKKNNLVAVLDRGKTYLGVVSLEDTISAFADSLLITPRGSELILSLDMKDYQLSEIARLVESENAKILNCFISQDPLNESKIKLSLKLDKPEIRGVKATFERFGFRVIEHFQEETAITNEEYRIANLLRFLDI